MTCTGLGNVELDVAECQVGFVGTLLSYDLIEELLVLLYLVGKRRRLRCAGLSQLQDGFGLRGVLLTVVEAYRKLSKGTTDSCMNFVELRGEVYEQCVQPSVGQSFLDFIP